MDNALKKMSLFVILINLPILAMESTVQESVEQQLQEIIKDLAQVRIAEQEQGKVFYPQVDASPREAVVMQRKLEQFLNPSDLSLSPFSKKIIELMPITFPYGDLINTLAFNNNGTQLASGAQDQKIVIWNLISNGNNQKFKNYKLTFNAVFSAYDQVFSVDFSPTEKNIIAATIFSNVRVWNVSTNNIIGDFSGGEIVFQVKFSPDGKTIAGGNRDSQLFFWDMLTKRKTVYPAYQHAVTCVSFNPDGTLLASGSALGDIKIWNFESIDKIVEITKFLGHDKQVNSIVFNPVGNILASGSWDNTIKLWDVNTKKEIATLRGHKNNVSSVSFSSDGKILASASWDKTIKLWDMKTNTLIATLSGHKDNVSTIAFSPIGEILASGSEDKTIKLWNIAAFLELIPFLKSLYADTKGLKKFLLLNAIFESNADKDAQGNPKKSTPLDLYQPEAIALLEDLPIWLQKPLQDKNMVRVFKKVGEKK